jgi:hypothetical protein
MPCRGSGTDCLPSRPMLLHSRQAAAQAPWQRSPCHPSISIRHSVQHLACPARLLSANERQSQSQRRARCESLLGVTAAIAHMSDHDHAEASGWSSLLLTCVLMFLGAYGCGMLPGWLPNQQRLTSSVSGLPAMLASLAQRLIHVQALQLGRFLVVLRRTATPTSVCLHACQAAPIWHALALLLAQRLSPLTCCMVATVALTACLQVGAVGAGLLLGSALCIILPEGFEAAIEVRARCSRDKQQRQQHAQCRTKHHGCICWRHQHADSSRRMGHPAIRFFWGGGRI